jgi:hypothetical protein
MAEKPVVSDPEVEATLVEIEQARQRLGAALAQLRQRVTRVRIENPGNHFFFRLGVVIDQTHRLYCGPGGLP